MNNKPINLSITYLRNMAIVAIVLHHSMIAFCGWPPNHAIGGNIPVFADVLSGFCYGGNSMDIEMD